MLRITLVAVLVCISARSQELPEPAVTLAHVKLKMAEALAQTTNYTCLATMERASRSSPERPFTRADTVRFEIANVAGRELFAWEGEGRFEDQSIGAALPYGVVSNGEYTLHARAVFTDGYATIRFVGRETLNGLDALRWNYVIPLFGSGWTISNRGRRVRTGAHGAFWVDPKTLDVMRLDMHADDLPPDFVNTAAATWVDYGRVQLGSRDVLLPQTAGLILDEKSGKRKLKQNLNLLVFSHCRQYSAESSVSFDEKAIPSLPARATTKDVELPAGLVLRLRLAAPIDSSTTAVGDRVNAITTTDVHHGSRIVVPSGVTAHGRVRRIERREGPPVQYALGLEFSELEWNGQRIRFFGDLERLEPAIKGLREIAGVGPVEYRSAPDSDAQIYNIPDIPGNATLLIEGAAFRIPAGTTMTWRSGKVKWSRPRLRSPNWAPGPSPSGR
ncbi:MAG TPA: hypothetical protein VEU96_21230 [Bryobacteraceae bacterium]|nr:hypothetical protein [Bryobacteraceae bacterium]